MPLNSQQLFDIVRQQIDKMQETHQILFTAQALGQLAPIDQAFLVRIDDWARRILGVVEGHGMEFEAYHKHRIVKGRTIYPTAGGIADVVLGGANDVFAKAIQSKSTIQRGDGAINDYLTAAFGQLAGTGHENPRPNDRPTILITIWDPSNTWPYSPSELNGGLPTWANFKNKVASVVSQKINHFVTQNANLFQWNVNDVNPQFVANPVSNFAQSFPQLPQGAQRGTLIQNNTPRPKSTPDYFTHDNHRLKTLLVKFKWPINYACSDAFVEGINLVGSGLPNGNGQFQFIVEKEKIIPVVPVAPVVQAIPAVMSINNLLNPSQ